MKKLVCIVILTSMVMSLSACGKSSAATNVDNLIVDIGEVTIQSGSKISAAEVAISQLTEKQKNQLENTEVLHKAKETYEGLIEQNAKEIEEAISLIGVVSLESEEVIDNANKLYEGSVQDVKEAVSNYEVLKKAKEEFDLLEIRNVESLINDIGTVTLNSEEKINIAEDAYCDLSSSQQGKVKNYDALSAACDKLEELKVNRAVSKLTVKTDKVEGNTWYYPKCKPYYADTRSYVLPYIGKNSSNTWLRLKYHYTGDSWIFFDSITIVVDGEKYRESFSYGEVERDNDSEVWEWVDISPTSSDIEMLKKIANSKETIVRFQGDQYHYDFTVSQNDKNGIKDILTAYEALK